MMMSEIAAALTGEEFMSKYTGGDDHASRDEIRLLAYQLYEARGRHDGQDVEDWLAAEEQLTRRCR